MTNKLRRKKRLLKEDKVMVLKNVPMKSSVISQSWFSRFKDWLISYANDS